MDIILASASPRRRELLEMLGVKNLRIVPARGEEQPLPGMSAAETVKLLARAKAKEVAATAAPGCAVIAADTVVECSGLILGKPKNSGEAFDMLKMLSGRTHSVFTGVTVICSGSTVSCAEKTDVSFRAMSDDEILAYIATGEPMDKAGSYGIQGIAGQFIEKINGDYYNVVGLPLCRLGLMLKDVGISLI